MLRFISKFLPRRPDVYEIYTDGSHKGRSGSWAFVILKNGDVITEKSGRVLKTDSTQMEIQAAIEALQLLPEGSDAKLFSDSRILIQAMTVKIEKWKAAGWVSKNNHPVPNAEQIQMLQALNENRKISWQWIKGHSGLKYNERCDFLCTQARLQN